MWHFLLKKNLNYTTIFQLICHVFICLFIYYFACPGDRNSGNGIKIPSKNPYNSPDMNNRNEKNVELENDHSRSVFGFLPSNFLPSSPAKLNVSFSGIACGGNGVEELMDGKGAPSALYVG